MSGMNRGMMEARKELWRARCDAAFLRRPLQLPVARARNGAAPAFARSNGRNRTRGENSAAGEEDCFAAPSLTETVYALGLQERLVGDTDIAITPRTRQRNTKWAGAI